MRSGTRSVYRFGFVQAGLGPVNREGARERGVTQKTKTVAVNRSAADYSRSPGVISFNDVDARTQAMIDATPMRRPGKPEEIAAAIHFDRTTISTAFAKSLREFAVYSDYSRTQRDNPRSYLVIDGIPIPRRMCQWKVNGLTGADDFRSAE